MKTAIQEAIEDIELQIKPISEQIIERHNLYDDGIHTGLLLAMSILKSKLPKEREQIEQAYGDGLNGHRTNFCNRNDYFTQTYGDGK